MPSHANPVRLGIERAARVVLLIVLAFAAWSATLPPLERGPAASGIDRLGDSLARWTAAAPPRVHVSLDAAPIPTERDWLRALRHAGTPVTWTGDEIPALAIEAAPVASPQGGTMLWIAAPRGTRVELADAVASIDTVTTVAGGASVFAPIVTGPVRATVDEQSASASVRDMVLPRHVLVLGRATWEAKFVISALEEAGWRVDARLTVAPGVDVTQGMARTPDTARHAAVVVLDAPSGSTSATIARYVRAGGGAILSGASASAPALAEIAGGRVGVRIRPSSIAFADDAPRRALGFLTITPRSDGIVLEERDGRIAAVARRADAGRVVQIGYDETWRWRLAGGATALDAHRGWWSALVSSVAYRAAMPIARVSRDDDAPRARLVDALGPPTATAPAIATRARWSPSPILLFVLMTTLLLSELASRRLRGAP